MTFYPTSMIFTLMYLAFVGLGVYCLVLFIKFARRGIKAFDLYIEEKTRNRS